jgi:hypothetical protein
VWCGVAWRGVAWRGVAWRGVAWRGVAWRGAARRGAARRGVVWRGVVVVVWCGGVAAWLRGATARQQRGGAATQQHGGVVGGRRPTRPRHSTPCPLQVYLARWHSSDVAVKCLNPALLAPDGSMGSAGGRRLGCAELAACCAFHCLLLAGHWAACCAPAGARAQQLEGVQQLTDQASPCSVPCPRPCPPAAGDDVVAELLKEASLLGSLRHPNIVWVYGQVLPALSGG